MPAYRSDDEAFIRNKCIEILRRARPNGRIMHEVNSSKWGRRMDLLCVGPGEIISVEIKSKRDKLDRLKAQIDEMTMVSHVAIAALHEKFLVMQPCPESQWLRPDIIRKGVKYRLELPEPADLGGEAVAWVFADPDPKKSKLGFTDRYALHELPRQSICAALPGTALNMLWNDELAAVMARAGLQRRKRATSSEMIQSIQWNMTGRDITRAICRALRQRVIVEGDAPIIEKTI